MERLETARLILRPWRLTEEDAADLYAYARDPRVGPITGWPVHRSMEDSWSVLREFVKDEDEWAMEYRASGRVIGAIGLHRRCPDEATEYLPHRELGYCLHPAFWGGGIMTEAATCALSYGFERLALRIVWCGHYDGNSRSRRVIEKCGFRYRFSRVEPVPLLQEEREAHYYSLTKEEWLVWQSR
jgi:ribosomal-protein-alanine N-acetyltransferase